jgi:hypothetical protein
MEQATPALFFYVSTLASRLSILQRVNADCLYAAGIRLQDAV